MVNNQKIVIGDRVLTREDLFKEKERSRKERAKLSFEEKIRILVNLQKLAKTWGKKKDVVIWKI
ncbi:MAG: hypothetical protein DDT42_01818 [candidate division WS2 bacterium]|uniref:Uncharacterized protein n=1 Tax=Psychracetigena formicireducens TaxID=2986056 RepID=A0A9E2BHZ0_PSYF1|nr:hypothetical protein [Candidatus Psychracetigena formicireducens]MBT9145940.1 hypothetical protein [Candidatus Psychracetigena formicireducens]